MHPGRCWSSEQATGLWRCAEVGAGRRGCCTLLLHPRRSGCCPARVLSASTYVRHRWPDRAFDRRLVTGGFHCLSGSDGTQTEDGCRSRSSVRWSWVSGETTARPCLRERRHPAIATLDARNRPALPGPPGFRPRRRQRRTVLRPPGQTRKDRCSRVPNCYNGLSPPNC
jgi:hypothetical protein